MGEGSFRLPLLSERSDFLIAASMLHDLPVFKPLRAPCYALIRGPLPGIGWQVATLRRPGEHQSEFLLLFSSLERAQAHAARSPMGFADWKPGPLPNAERLVFFLKNMARSLPYLCLDANPDSPYEDPLVAVDEALERLRATESSGNSGPLQD